MKKFNILTYNIEFCRNPEQIIHNICSIKDITVICLQEVIPVPGNGFIIDELQKKLGKDWQAEYYIGEGEPHHALGVAILWNAKVVRMENIERYLLPKMEKLAIYEKFVEKITGYSGKPVQRKVLMATFSCEGEKVRLTNLHLDAMGGSKQRMKQLKFLVNQIKSKPEIKRDIICGDFNTLNKKESARHLKTVKQILSEEFTNHTNHIPWTVDIYNANFSKERAFLNKLIKKLHIHFRVKTDHIISRGLIANDVQKLEHFNGSDHKPLYATFSFDDPDDRINSDKFR